MSLENPQRKRQRDNERGSVMIMTAILMAGIILAVGLCIDIARIYMVRTELQNAADAAALAAARELDSGAGEFRTPLHAPLPLLTVTALTTLPCLSRLRTWSLP